MMKQIFKYHFEWMALLGGLVVMAILNPYVENGHTWCLFEMAGIGFCPGQGIGHSIAYTVRGDFTRALHAHPFGPAAVLILTSRIGYLWKRAAKNIKQDEEEMIYG